MRTAVAADRPRCKAPAAGRIHVRREETADVRNTTLHHLLEELTLDAGSRLAAEKASGAEIPFELIEESGGRVPLYCYRPLTGDFIRERLGLLTVLETYAPAARALTGLQALDAYLLEHGEPRLPAEPRQRADATLRTFLSCVFDERSEFGFSPARFEAAYAELERALYGGQFTAMVIAPLLGVALDPQTTELALGDGLSLVCGDALVDAPADAVWGDGEEPNVLAVLAVAQDRSAPPPVSLARARFRRILTALRLFERGGYALGPGAWSRTAGGTWRPVAIGGSGRPGFLTLVPAAHEDELRAFCNLVARRLPRGGELAWALARFEMGCERLSPFEALTDHLLALRALLEPEGPASGRLPHRLAAICAKPEQQAALAQRVGRAIALERAVIDRVAPAQPGEDALVGELSEHLRAVLRDALCGHLEADLRAVADRLLTEAAAGRPIASVFAAASTPAR